MSATCQQGTFSIIGGRGKAAGDRPSRPLETSDQLFGHLAVLLSVVNLKTDPSYR